jgi:glycosyltransferase involved in cell wall biosynthesis
VHGVVSVSSSTLETLNELYDLAIPTTRIPCAVDPDSLVPSSPRAVIRRKADTPLEARVVLYVGSLSVEKRVDRLIRIVTTARRTIPNLYLWIVGEGPKRAALEMQVKASSLEPCVRFMGVQNEVSNYMSAADLVALTSDTEGMPAVVLEAGLLERPVVTTRVGGLNECILDGRTGMLIERHDEAGFSQSIVDLLQRPDRLQGFGRAAKQWIEQNFVIARVAEQYETFYQRVLSDASAVTH